MGLIDVCHLDEAGFSMTLPPCGSWFLEGERLGVAYEVPQGRRVNVLGAHFTHGPEAGRFAYQSWACLPNAAKYTAADRGPIVLSITPGQAPDGAVHVLASVRDRGPGVADEELPRLFERRYRTSSAESGSASGFGLGLYIARRIVEAHDGRIWAEHAAGGGLVVHLLLPAAES